MCRSTVRPGRAATGTLAKHALGNREKYEKRERIHILVVACFLLDCAATRELCSRS